jgi:prolyl-tRNA synthetase
MEQATQRVKELMEEIQDTLYANAKQRLRANSITMSDYDDFKALMKPVTAERGGGKFVWTGWCGSPRCEERVKGETKATIRCIPLASMDKDLSGTFCMVCGDAAHHEVVWAKAY